MKIIGLAIVMLATLSACGGKKEVGGSSNDMKIVFYVKDSIPENFEYYKTNSEELRTEEESINKRLGDLQMEGGKLANQYETKMAQGVLAPNGRAFYENKIKTIQDEIRSIQESEGVVLNDKAAKFEKDLLEKMDKHSKQYAADHKINLFLAKEKMGGILYADSTLDVTMDFIKYMNEQEKKK